MFVKRHESRRQTVWNRKGTRGIGEGDTKNTTWVLSEKIG
jgi:hypothetical protein